jgi:hypothetical protein
VSSVLSPCPMLLRYYHRPGPRSVDCTVTARSLAPQFRINRVTAHSCRLLVSTLLATFHSDYPLFTHKSETPPAHRLPRNTQFTVKFLLRSERSRRTRNTHTQNRYLEAWLCKLYASATLIHEKLTLMKFSREINTSH